MTHHEFIDLKLIEAYAIEPYPGAGTGIGRSACAIHLARAHNRN